MNIFVINIKRPTLLKKDLTIFQKILKIIKNKKFYSEENIKKLIYLSSKADVRESVAFFNMRIDDKMETLNFVDKLLNYIRKL